LSRKGKKVGLLDVDICGPSIPKLLNVEKGQVTNSPYGWVPVKDPVYGISVMSIQFMLQHPDFPVVWRGPRKTTMIKRLLRDTFWGRLDYLVVDTPPGTSDEHLTVISSLKKAKPDGAIVVTTPQQLSLATIRKELNFCSKMNLRVLGIVENMSGFVCPCCEERTDIFLSGGGQQLAEEYQLPLLARIPLDPRLADCAEKGLSPFTTLLPNTKTNTEQDERIESAVVSELCHLVEQLNTILTH
jgi:Mrp family chromosome partitioning ATPase